MIVTEPIRSSHASELANENFAGQRPFFPMTLPESSRDPAGRRTGSQNMDRP
jgi:hypothetical protein